MKVLMFPYSDLNPYQRLLAGGLNSNGIDVSFDKNSFSLGKILNPRFDLLHLHWLPTDPIRRIYLLKRILLLKTKGVPVVWTVHNLYSHGGGGAVELRYRRIVARIVSKIICHCTLAKDLIVEDYKVSPNKVRVVPHGNYASIYPSLMDKETARKRLDLPSTGLVFLHFGMIKEYKGVPELIRSFKRIKDRATLLIAGKIDSPALEKKIRALRGEDKRIRLNFGYVSDEDTNIYFSAVDCAVFPYTDILTSGTVSLAATFGRAVIAPMVGCIPSQTDQDGKLLYDPNDKDGLLKVLTDSFQEDLSILGNKNFEKSKELTWNKIARETAKVYEEALR